MNLTEVLSKARRARLSKADIDFLSKQPAPIETATVKAVLKAARKGRLKVINVDFLDRVLAPRMVLNGKELVPETPMLPINTVEHPKHYNAHPSGVECIVVVEHMGFNLGNAVKYIWRADEKGAPIEDLKKARWYLDREIARRQA